ncbi:MAG: hypothetical protein JNK79_01545 [Chitinophagaceae bacterium]|nr:hypothetical protein [Chitinophagaceae bacterium]
MSTSYYTPLQFDEEQMRQVIDRAQELLIYRYDDFEDRLSRYDRPVDTVAEALTIALEEAERKKITDPLLLTYLLEWVAIDVFGRMYSSKGGPFKPFTRTDLTPYFTILEKLKEILREIFTGR